MVCSQFRLSTCVANGGSSSKSGCPMAIYFTANCVSMKAGVTLQSKNNSIGVLLTEDKLIKFKLPIDAKFGSSTDANNLYCVWSCFVNSSILPATTLESN